MMASRIVPIETMEAPRKRRPRVEDGAHLALVRQLPCVVSGRRPVEAAHLRSGSRKHGKRETGMSEKPDDKWVLPLHAEFHREQHRGNELQFWAWHGIDPFVVALSLWAASGDLQTMEQIVGEARQ